MNFEFQLAKSQDFNLSQRVGEKRLWEEFIFGVPTTKSQFVILGISEDHGPQFNMGLSGAHIGFKSCIERLGHMQSNFFMSGEQVCVLGEIRQAKSFDPKQNTIPELDEFVLKLLNETVSNSHKLIVLGGGHNNALPLLRHAAKNKGAVHCINIDPHADLREPTDRHSGNPFSFAFEEKSLSRYHVVGLHEAYNNQYILDYFQQDHLSFQSFEDFLDAPADFWLNLSNYLKSSEHDIQLDIDLDTIPFMPSSAWTPSGFSLDQVRSLLRFISRQKNIHCLHLPEGAPKTEDELKFYSKGVAYLMADYIKTQQNKIAP